MYMWRIRLKYFHKRDIFGSTGSRCYLDYSKRVNLYVLDFWIISQILGKYYVSCPILTPNKHTVFRSSH